MVSGRRALVDGGVDDESVAEAAATAAGRELLELRAELDELGSNGREIGRQGDLRSNAVLHAALAAA